MANAPDLALLKRKNRPEYLRLRAVLKEALSQE